MIKKNKLNYFVLCGYKDFEEILLDCMRRSNIKLSESYFGKIGFNTKLGREMRNYFKKVAISLKEKSK